MTETVLIYGLFVLTITRLILFLEPSRLCSLDPILRLKLKELIDAVVWAGVVAILLIHFVVRSFYIPSESMEPTLEVNDFILVNELIYHFTEPSRGEVVVFHPPPGYTGPPTDLIKRVVAVEHDTVEIRQGKLYVNGIELEEVYLAEAMSGSFNFTRVMEDHIFVLGDNRNFSHDSRAMGQVPLSVLVGRAECIFFPPARASLLGPVDIWHSEPNAGHFSPPGVEFSVE
ncbi:MAG: signal peptidase I [Vulcanimicrobiota bacterium]